MLSAVFENRVSTRADKDSQLQSGTVMATPGLHTVERGGTERRKGSIRVFTQAAPLSAWFISALQETAIRISGAGIMENLEVFQSSKKGNRKPPHLYEMTNLSSSNGRSS